MITSGCGSRQCHVHTVEGSCREYTCSASAMSRFRPGLQLKGGLYCCAPMHASFTRITSPISGALRWNNRCMRSQYFSTSGHGLQQRIISQSPPKSFSEDGGIPPTTISCSWPLGGKHWTHAAETQGSLQTVLGNELSITLQIIDAQKPRDYLQLLKSNDIDAVYMGLGLLDYYDLFKTFKISDLMMANNIEPIAKSVKKRYGEFLPLIQTCILRRIPHFPIGRDQAAMLTSNARAVLRHPQEVLTLYKLIMSGAEKEFGEDGMLDLIRTFAPNYYCSWLTGDAKCIVYNFHTQLFDIITKHTNTGAPDETLSDRKDGKVTKTDAPIPLTVRQTVRALGELGVHMKERDAKWTKQSRGEKVLLPMDEIKRKGISKIEIRRAQMRAAIIDQCQFVEPNFFKNGARKITERRTRDSSKPIPIRIVVVCRRETMQEVTQILTGEFSRLHEVEPKVKEIADFKRFSNITIGFAWLVFVIMPFLGFLYLLHMAFYAWNLYFTQGRQVSVGGDELLEQWHRQGSLGCPPAINSSGAITPVAPTVNQKPGYKKVSTSFLDLNSFYQNDKRD